MLLHPSDYQIIDNWDVFAMKGTGSKRVAIEKEISIPAYRVIEGGLGEDPLVGKILEGLENPLYHGLLGPFLVGRVPRLRSESRAARSISMKKC